MAAGAWDRTAMQCYATAASMGAKNVRPEMFNPMRRTRKAQGSIDGLIGDMEEWVKFNGPKGG